MSSSVRSTHSDRNEETDFLALSAHLKKLTGINLPSSPKNVTLIESRMQKLMRVHGMSKLGEIVRLLDQRDAALTQAFISAMTTNTTRFFREDAHFDLLTSLVPTMAKEQIRNGSSELRIWCAASSTGEEPYTIAMVAAEALGALPCNLKILATDIDYQVLQKASQGRYNVTEDLNIPQHLLFKYFDKVKAGAGQSIQVKPELRAQLHFARLNLLNTPYPFQHKFDIIFCRNVFIYFDPPTVAHIVENMAAGLRQDGYLFVGHSEALVNVQFGLKRHMAAVYKKA